MDHGLVDRADGGVARHRNLGHQPVALAWGQIDRVRYRRLVGVADLMHAVVVGVLPQQHRPALVGGGADVQADGLPAVVGHRVAIEADRAGYRVAAVVGLDGDRLASTLRGVGGRGSRAACDGGGGDRGGVDRAQRHHQRYLDANQDVVGGIGPQRRRLSNRGILRVLVAIAVHILVDGGLPASVGGRRQVEHAGQVADGQHVGIVTGLARHAFALVVGRERYGGEPRRPRRPARRLPSPWPGHSPAWTRCWRRCRSDRRTGCRRPAGHRCTCRRRSTRRPCSPWPGGWPWPTRCWRRCRSDKTACCHWLTAHRRTCRRWSVRRLPLPWSGGAPVPPSCWRRCRSDRTAWVSLDGSP